MRNINNISLCVAVVWKKSSFNYYEYCGYCRWVRERNMKNMQEKKVKVKFFLFMLTQISIEPSETNFNVESSINFNTERKLTFFYSHRMRMLNQVKIVEILLESILLWLLKMFKMLLQYLRWRLLSHVYLQVSYLEIRWAFNYKCV